MLEAQTFLKVKVQSPITVVSKLTGEAKRGYRIRTVPRESVDRTQDTVIVVEHAYGFAMHRKELEAYEADGTSAINTEDAIEAARVVAKSVDDIIFNGDSNHGVKGILCRCRWTMELHQ